MSWANTPIVPPPETMTKREAFAMAAMQGILATPADDFEDDIEATPEGLASFAVECADALIAELEKQK